jgi:hypothetical protein
MSAPNAIARVVGLTDPASAVFVKQYGERRTGTNAVRALMTLNFTNLFVLMHILGDKHSVPADLGRLYDDIRARPDAAWRFAMDPTYATQAKTTNQGSYLEARFIHALHDLLFEAFGAGRLHYVVSVRHPHAWAPGLLRFFGWPEAWPADSWELQAAADILRDACHQSNVRHEAWLALRRNQYGARVVMVPNERLTREPAAVIDDLARTLGLTRAAPEPLRLGASVEPTHWDYKKSKAADEWFEPRPPSTPGPFPEALHDVVTREIDWSIMARLGYWPIPYGAPALDGRPAADDDGALPIDVPDAALRST